MTDILSAVAACGLFMIVAALIIIVLWEMFK